VIVTSVRDVPSTARVLCQEVRTLPARPADHDLVPRLWTMLLLAKVLPPGAIRLVDVSPGPLRFDELEDHATFRKRIAFLRVQYFARIDRFVS
jgi:hypothetical protein